MSDPLLISLFLFIVFAPCLVACGAGDDEDREGRIYPDDWGFARRRGSKPVPLQAMLPEIALAKDFAIRSFPKGLSRRRIVVRDSESGVKLTIAQVRAAAAELVKLGGMAAAHQFALVAAASAAAMTLVKNAFAVAALEAMESARKAHLWVRREALPPPRAVALPPRAMPDRRWREVSQAA
jgi:hypothetical protein